MKVIRVKNVENCFDGGAIRELLFDEVVTKEFIHYMGKNGNLQYFDSFAKPYYCIDNPKGFSIKGVEGNKSARIVLSGNQLDTSFSFFKNVVDAWQT